MKSKTHKKKVEDERDKLIKILRIKLENKLISIKRDCQTRPNTPTPEEYENINLENIKDMKI